MRTRHDPDQLADLPLPGHRGKPDEAIDAMNRARGGKGYRFGLLTVDGETWRHQQAHVLGEDVEPLPEDVARSYDASWAAFCSTAQEDVGGVPDRALVEAAVGCSRRMPRDMLAVALLVLEMARRMEA